MYYIQFFRTCKNFLDDEKFVFQRASGYGVFIDGVEYAIARCTDSPKEWDVTEVSTGLSLDIDGEHKMFPTRDSALEWLKVFTKENDIKVRIKKHESTKRALEKYSEPYRVKKKQNKQAMDITLTPKQREFLTFYIGAFGINPCETKEVSREIGMNPSVVGAMISTLIEKGVFESFLEGKVRYIELTEVGLELMEDING